MKQYSILLCCFYISLFGYDYSDRITQDDRNAFKTLLGNSRLVDISGRHFTSIEENVDTIKVKPALPNLNVKFVDADIIRIQLPSSISNPIDNKCLIQVLFLSEGEETDGITEFYAYCKPISSTASSSGELELKVLSVDTVYPSSLASKGNDIETEYSRMYYAKDKYLSVERVLSGDSMTASQFVLYTDSNGSDIKNVRPISKVRLPDQEGFFPLIDQDYIETSNMLDIPGKHALRVELKKNISESQSMYISQTNNGAVMVVDNAKSADRSGRGLFAVHINDNNYISHFNGFYPSENPEFLVNQVSIGDNKNPSVLDPGCVMLEVAGSSTLTMENLIFDLKNGEVLRWTKSEVFPTDFKLDSSELIDLNDVENKKIIPSEMKDALTKAEQESDLIKQKAHEIVKNSSKLKEYEGRISFINLYYSGWDGCFRSKEKDGKIVYEYVLIVGNHKEKNENVDAILSSLDQETLQATKYFDKDLFAKAIIIELSAEYVNEIAQIIDRNGEKIIDSPWQSLVKKKDLGYFDISVVMLRGNYFNEIDSSQSMYLLDFFLAKKRQATEDINLKASFFKLGAIIRSTGSQEAQAIIQANEDVAQVIQAIMNRVKNYIDGNIMNDINSQVTYDKTHFLFDVFQSQDIWNATNSNADRLSILENLQQELDKPDFSYQSLKTENQQQAEASIWSGLGLGFLFSS